MVPKYHSSNVYTKQLYKTPHSTVWAHLSVSIWPEHICQSALAAVENLRAIRLECIAHRFGSGKLYICLSNKCFKENTVYSLCTDVRPS